MIVNNTAQFISAPLRPDPKTFDVNRMAAGEPGLPSVVYWNEQTIRIVRVVRTWRETGKCDHGSTDMYVRKHWYKVVTDAGQIMKIYFERQPRFGKSKCRWWLFSIQESEGSS